MDASCGLSPRACSLGIRSALIKLLIDVDGMDDSGSCGGIKLGCCNKIC